MSGPAEDSAKKVAEKILEIWRGKRTAALFALANKYANLAADDFLQRQLGNEFWDNRTKQALTRVFTKAFRRKSSLSVGFRMAHGVEYGVYLERANNRKHAALLPLIRKWGPLYIAEARRLLA